MIRVALVSANGTSGKGGISRFCDYLVRAVGDSPLTRITVHTTLPTDTRILRGLLDIPTLALFAARCGRRYDVVHLNVAPGNSTSRKRRYQVAAARHGVPTVVHLHGSGYDDWYAGLEGRKAAVVRRLFDEAAHVIVCGEHWRRFVVDRLGIEDARVSVVPNGVPDVGSAAVPTNGRARLITLGLVGERKGTDVLVNALARLPSDVDWHATVAGPGEIGAAVRHRDSLGLGDAVTFPGWWPEATARDELARSDVFVLASRRENQPVAIVEAMAAGLPVVSTDIAAIPEVVQHGVTGLIVPPDDVAALAEALEALLRSPQRRLEMGRAARARYETEFTIERCVERILEVYRTVVPPRTL